MLMTRDEMLTPSEAALVASVTVREIHRVIDEHILPERFYAMDGGRRLHLAACPLVAFYFHAAKALTADERSLVIRRLADRIGTGAAGNAVKSWRQACIRAGGLDNQRWFPDGHPMGVRDKCRGSLRRACASA
jgi:hypothetical protein